MAVIARKHKGAWWLFINHRGQRKAKKVGERAAAMELKGQIEARLSAGDLGILDKPGITFAEASEQWLEGYVRRRLKPRSYELYRLLAEKYLLPVLSTVPLRHITRDQIKKLVDGLYEKGLGRKYVDTILATLSGILQEAIEGGHLDHNPASKLGRYMQRHTGETETDDKVKYWTEEQLIRLLARTKEDYPDWHDLFATLAWAGFRVGEALSLQWDDVDQDERAIYLKRMVYEKGRQMRVGTPKGNRGRRIEMAERLARLLADRKTRQEAEAALAGQPRSKWVFPGTEDQAARYSVVCKVLSHVLDLEKIPKHKRVMTHAFRHSWATWILQNAPTPGAILYVSRQLGHSSVKLTLDVYSHVIPEENRHLSDRLAEATSGGSTTRNPDATAKDQASQPTDSTGASIAPR